MKIAYKPTTHPSIPTATWTKVLDTNEARKGFIIANESPTVNMRVAMTYILPTLATDGLPLNSGGDGVVESDFDAQYCGPVYIYQASGGASVACGIVEGF